MNDQLKGGLQADVVASSIDIITSEILGKAQFYIPTLSFYCEFDSFSTHASLDS